MRRVLVLVCIFGLFASGNGQCQEENASPTKGVISFCNDPNCPGCRAFLAGYAGPSCSCETSPSDAVGGVGGPGEDAGLGEDLFAGDYGGGYGYDALAPNMIGDSLIGGGMLTHMDGGPSQASAASLYSFHTFKIAEDESPWPKNRNFFDVNDYNNVPGTDSITRFMVGLERTFWDGQASIGLRLPVWHADIENLPSPFLFGSAVPFASAGTNTALGDMTLTLKAKLAERATGVLTSGVSFTLPTGPDTLANVDPFYSIDNVTHLGAVQPWLGWYRARESLDYGLFTQAFLAFDLPVDQQDADYLFLDLGAGYRMPRDGFITAITPMFEAHWSTPIADREQTYTLTPLGLSELPGPAQRSLTGGILGYRNQLNLTSAVNLELDGYRTLVLGVAVPTVGPQVMDFEFICQLNGFMF